MYKTNQDCDGNFIIYHIIAPEANTIFQIDIADIAVAQKFCNYLSNRDNKNYIIKKYFMCIGMPIYRDKDIICCLREGGYW